MAVEPGAIQAALWLVLLVSVVTAPFWWDPLQDALGKSRPVDSFAHAFIGGGK